MTTRDEVLNETSKTINDATEMWHAHLKESGVYHPAHTVAEAVMVQLAVANAANTFNICKTLYDINNQLAEILKALNKE
jgi:hypothetical protein